MKKTAPKLFLLFAAAFLFILPQSCKQNAKKQEHQHEQAEADAHEHEDDHAHSHEGVDSDMLTLNNGSKWMADEPTNKNASILISIGEMFSKDSDKTLEDYHTFGNDINAAINLMIKECSMKGEADQALHYWFLPLLEQVNTIKEATDTIGLGTITSEMIHRLKEYNDYFE